MSYTPESKTIDIIKNLSESNAQLVRMTDDGIGEALYSTKRYIELIQHCGKIYEYLNRKNDKTWEEHEMVEELYDLITNSKINGSAEK